MYQDRADTTNGIGNACPPEEAAKAPSWVAIPGVLIMASYIFQQTNCGFWEQRHYCLRRELLTDSVCMTGNATFSLAGTAGLPTPIPVSLERRPRGVNMKNLQVVPNRLLGRTQTWISAWDARICCLSRAKRCLSDSDAASTSPFDAE